MQVHNTPTATAPDNGVLPALMLLILDVHLLHVFPIFLVLVLVVRADDQGTEPGGRAEPHGEVAEVFLGRLVLLEGRFGHVGAPVLQFANGFVTYGRFEEGGHGWRSQPVAVGWECTM